MTSESILKDFKTRFIEFLDELMVQFPEEPDFIVARVFVADEIPISAIVDEIIRIVIPHKSQITERNADFFFTSKNIKSQTGGYVKKIQAYQRIWTTLDKEDRNVLWEWFDLFIKLVEKYMECKFKSK